MSSSDPQLWLPLLKGFFKRDGSNSLSQTDIGFNLTKAEESPEIDKLSLSTLTKFQAERTISSWLVLNCKRRKEKQAKLFERGIHPKHFLLRALSSSSLQVRRLAATIILDVTDPMQLVKARLNHHIKPNLDPTGRVLLRDLFWNLAKKDIEDLVTYVTPDPMITSLYLPSNDGVIQIYGVLSHLIFDDEGAWYAEMYKDDEQHRFVPFRSIEHFIIAGGLRWITSSIVKLTSTLLQEEGFADYHNSQFISNDKPYADAVQLRIILLVHLCSRLVMDVSLNPIRFPEEYWKSSSTEMVKDSTSNLSVDEFVLGVDVLGTIARIEKKRKQCRINTLFKGFHLLWSSPFSASKTCVLSPLASLIACYAVFRREEDLNSISNLSRTNQDPKCSGNDFTNLFELPFIPQRREGMDQCLHCLQQMVDPAGNLFFLKATYPAAPDPETNGKSQNDTSKVTSLLSDGGATCAPSDNQNKRKRSSSSCDNGPKKKSYITSDMTMDEIETYLEDRSRHFLSDPLINDDDCDDDHDEDGDDDDEIVEEDIHDDGMMINMDDECDHDESDDDDCSDDDNLESAACDDEAVSRKVKGNERNCEAEFVAWEKISLSDALSSVIPQVEREKSLIRASMEVLHAQYRQRWTYQNTNLPASKSYSKISSTPLLTISAEQYLLQDMCNIVRPPPKPFKMKIVMKRTPTQEEFFRGSLSRNPINLDSIKVSDQSSPSRSTRSVDEPCVRDLRQHIARDLKMEDSAELLELLVDKKILGLSLKLRVVAQVIWRKYVMEKAPSNSSSFISSSVFNRRAEPGVSLLLGVSGDTDVCNSVDDSLLPPMVVTYRLIGVDGEATEERVEDGDLIDPEAVNDAQSSDDNEKSLEYQYGLTYIVTEQNGIHVLLDSLESYLTLCMRNIRRDDVSRKYQHRESNPARMLFLKSRPCPSLVLLRHCARLKGNRVKMVRYRAPTKLLRILLNLLSCLEESRSAMDVIKCDVETLNPTAGHLQELIETLSSVISLDSASFCIDDQNTEDDASLRLLLSSLNSTCLSLELRTVVSKLLPYLTYGQPQLSSYLATEFVSFIQLESLDCNVLDKCDNSLVMMDTFVQCAMHLPPNAVCQHLREELLKLNFVMNLVEFVIRLMPSTPPHWCPALFESSKKLELHEKQLNERDWSLYFGRKGLIVALRILISLSTNHVPTQNAICGLTDQPKQSFSLRRERNNFIVLCHWLENTSDFNSINTCGLGIHAETLLDTMIETNIEVKKIISNIRDTTRERKKAIADERRKSLMVMNSFSLAPTQDISSNSNKVAKSPLRKNVDEILPRENVDGCETKRDKNNTILSSDHSKQTLTKPKWLEEMECMEDESGLTCVVCQEGRQIIPEELLGLYCFTKKVTVTSKMNLTFINGLELLLALPISSPPVAWNEPEYENMIDSVRSTVDKLKHTQREKTSRSIESSNAFFMTTVSAGNAIHCNCHAKARVADKNHAKHTKSEWEGATLRNSRVDCNLILPLLSPSVSKVPRSVVDSFVEEYTNEIARIAGSRPKCMFWLILHDIYFLILRMSCGESLTHDSGGGSLTSNSLLIFYLLFLANKYKANQIDSFNHASALSRSLILGWKAIQSNDHGMESSAISCLRLGIAEAAPMASICCILFHNSLKVCSNNDSTSEVHWSSYREVFCTALVFTAGHRHALGIEGSGCAPTRTSFTGKRIRSTSFHDWGDETLADKTNETTIMTKLKSLIVKRPTCPLDQYAKALRPMLTMFTILDQLAGKFFLDMNDDVIDQGSVSLANFIESCQKSENLAALLKIGNIPIDKGRILDAFDRGYKTGKRK